MKIIKNKGFTLIELLVVVAISDFLLSIVSVVLSSSRNRTTIAGGFSLLFDGNDWQNII